MSKKYSIITISLLIILIVPLSFIGISYTSKQAEKIENLELQSSMKQESIEKYYQNDWNAVLNDFSFPDSENYIGTCFYFNSYACDGCVKNELYVIKKWIEDKKTTSGSENVNLKIICNSTSLTKLIDIEEKYIICDPSIVINIDMPFYFWWDKSKHSRLFIPVSLQPQVTYDYLNFMYSL